MKLNRLEIAEELEHRQTMASTIRKRLRVLELQMAQHGISTPPQILTEIASMTEQIRNHENEISRLETLAVEDNLSLAEADYRWILAQAWDINRPWPRLTDVTWLELQRLKKGLTPERAHQLENEVRAKLAEEVFFSLNPELETWIPFIPDTHNILEQKASNAQMEMLGNAIRRDVQTSVQLFLRMLPPNVQLNFDEFDLSLMKANRIWIYQEDKAIFEEFLTKIRELLK